MARILTKVGIDHLKPDPTRRVEVSDAMLPALRVIVQPNGSKSYAVRYRRDGRPAKFTIGSTERFSLGEAREAARQALSLAAKGQDPFAARKAERTSRLAAARATEDLVESALEDFLNRHVAKLKSAPHVERLLRVELRPWIGRRVQEVAKRDVIRLIDAVHDRGSPTTARRLLANIKRFFSWLIERDVLQVSPCAGVKAPSKEVQRDRILTDDELKTVVLAADRLGHPFGPLIKVLVLTGARREEVAGMRWSELQLDGAAPVWCLPPSRTKNGRAHDVPLAPAVRDLIVGLARIGNGGQPPAFVFTTNGTAHVSGYSKARARLEEHIAAVCADGTLSDGRSKPPALWRLHDLRRTFASGCARLGVSLPIVERCLNHVSGSFAGIVGVYQRHDFAAEKRLAFERWADHVMHLEFIDKMASGRATD